MKIASFNIDFLPAAVAAKERAGAALVASGDRDAFQLALPRTTILYPSRGGEMARRYGSLDGVLDAGLFLTKAKMLRLY
jgi:hypothetical protein